MRATPLPDTWSGQRAISGPSDPTRDDLRPCEYAVVSSTVPAAYGLEAA